MRAFLAALFVCLFAFAFSEPAFAGYTGGYSGHAKAPAHSSASSDRRPARWCGWFMRRVKNVSDPSFNLARNWAHWGSNAGGPHVGVVVVWTYHVGEIVGGPDAKGRWLVHSGNDGNAVRTRYLPVNRAIAFRE